MSDYRKTLASRIKALRIARGLSQEQVADAAGIVRQSISFIEQGSTWPNYATLESLAEVFKVQTEYFFASDEPSIASFEAIPAPSARAVRGLEQVARKLERLRATVDTLLTPAETRLLIAARKVASLAGDDAEVERAARLLETVAETLAAKRVRQDRQVSEKPTRRRR